MSREGSYECLWCKKRISHGSRQAMQNDFDYLDVPINNNDPQENDTPMFRDTVNALNRLGLKGAIPGFLHNQKRLPVDEANRTRFITKNRWVIESGKT
ncbi:unnamed protein product [Rotaria sp. Silwood2]|nr:unnamed protein product [Rotaria sp. Silwood2]